MISFSLEFPDQLPVLVQYFFGSATVHVVGSCMNDIEGVIVCVLGDVIAGCSDVVESGSWKTEALSFVTCNPTTKLHQLSTEN